ncbi:MAG: metallophosphoesterase family protein [Planctomycetota bacterium]
MPQKTLILSDTHLGRPNSVTADALRPVWEGVDELVINGDAAEVQVPWLRGKAVRELDRLEEMARIDGVRLTMISGNHDAYLTDRRCLQLANEQILVMHGDALHPAVAPWTRYAKSLKQRTERELAKKERTDLAARLDIAQHVGHSEFLRDYVLSKAGEHTVRRLLARPIEIPKVLWYWKQEAAMGQRFLEQYAPKTRYLIVGHSHRAGIRRRGGRVIINTGAFMFPGQPRCVIHEGDTLSVYRVKKQGRAFARSPEALVQLSDARLLNDTTPTSSPRPQAA